MTTLTSPRTVTAKDMKASFALTDPTHPLLEGESEVLRALQEVFEQQRRRVSLVRLAGLTALALEAVVGTRQRPGDRVARALSRGLTARHELATAEGGSLSSEEVADLLGISKTAVLKRFHAGRLLAWRDERQNAVRFPAWQFDQGRVLAGLGEALAVLAEGERLDDWGRVLFFLQSSAVLRGGRPLDALREGRAGAVVKAARAYVE